MCPTCHKPRATQRDSEHHDAQAADCLNIPEKSVAALRAHITRGTYANNDTQKEVS